MTKSQIFWILIAAMVILTIIVVHRAQRRIVDNGIKQKLIKLGANATFTLDELVELTSYSPKAVGSFLRRQSRTPSIKHRAQVGRYELTPEGWTRYDNEIRVRSGYQPKIKA